MQRIKSEVIEEIKSDPALYALVAVAMGVKPAFLVNALNRNGKNLSQFHVVKAIAEFKKVEPEEILENAVLPEPARGQS